MHGLEPPSIVKCMEQEALQYIVSQRCCITIDVVHGFGSVMDRMRFPMLRLQDEAEAECLIIGPLSHSSLTRDTKETCGVWMQGWQQLARMMLVQPEASGNVA
jgi:hypothetical protein